MLDTVIIGSGPAGLSAAIYAQRAQLEALVLEKDYMGLGQIAASEQVDNYPGLMGINGYDLGEKFREHAEKLGAKFKNAQAEKITVENDYYKVKLEDGEELETRTVIYTAGTSYRHLNVPGEEKQGVSFCAVCDGFFYKDKTVAVIGGGDTALGDAIYLSKLAKTVYICHRRGEFRANKTLQEKVKSTENIELVLNSVPKEIIGEKRVEGIKLDVNGEEKVLAADGIFVAVGSVPNSQLLEGICELDERGYVIAGEDCKTSEKGIFAAGDIRTTPLRQVVTAAADGANAVLSAEEYINSQAVK